MSECINSDSSEREEKILLKKVYFHLVYIRYIFMVCVEEILMYFLFLSVLFWEL